MSYVLFESQAVTNVVLTVADLAPPAAATGVVLLAETGTIRFTMDGTTAPTTSTGMMLKITDPPTEFHLEDLKNIKFIRNAAQDAVLLVHYFK